jgi:hypothetical protein
MRIAVRLALAVTAIALLGPVARAQQTLPPPYSSTTYVYRDSQGPGRITITDLGSPQDGDSRVIRVTIIQNGFTYSGTGYSYPLSPNNPQLLLSFMVEDARGTDYVFQGKLMPGFGVTGGGTYHQQGYGNQTYWWRIEGLAQ